ncbi:hypothetical protein [Nostoc sp.]
MSTPQEVIEYFFIEERQRAEGRRDLSQLFLPDSAALATQERHRLRD